MSEPSESTVEYLWSRARLYSKGDYGDREFGAGMQEVLRHLGIAEPGAAKAEALPTPSDAA